MDISILSQNHKEYKRIKHMNEDCLYTIYFDPQKYPFSKQYKGEVYSLLYKDLAASAIKQGYQIVKNGFYVVGALTTNRFSCSMCI